MIREGETALSTLYQNVSRMRRVPHRRTVLFATTVALCVTAALLVGVGWTVGNKLNSTDAENTPPAAAAWNGSGGMITTTTETDAQSLRAEGWTLPSLASEGYQVESMVQGEVAGQPMVAITLVNDHHRVQVIEQRGDVNPNNPVDGATGLPVSAEGLHESAVEGTQLWVVRSEPWRAVMSRDDVVYTVMTDASPSTLSRTLTLVAAEERGRVTLPGSEPDGFGTTVLDGLREIVG
ncbi:hypothetical protein [Kocuria atrinae]|uniref:hypothetical protein n=1 Tax=Kocuria atrinae TaxID=592377 RepID=UPI00035D4880|nr:hypothetical protein [Kocuria atrinae]